MKRRPRPYEAAPEPLAEARTWEELTTLPRDEAVDLRADVIVGRRPLSDLPDWDAAKAGDLAALERINRAVELRLLLGTY